MNRPFAWEKTYPPGVSWDAPIEVSTVSALLDEGLARSADRAVFDFRDRAISYRELADKVDRLAAAFLARGIGPGSAVGLYLPNTPYHPIAFFACMKAGIRAVHMSALEAERELAHKLKDSGARVLVDHELGGASAEGREAQGERARRPPRRRRRRCMGPGPIPLAPMPPPRRRRDDSLTSSAMPGGTLRAAARRRRRCRAPAIHRRHDRPAEGRDADSTRTSLRRCRATTPGTRPASPRLSTRGPLRPAAVPHLRADDRSAAPGKHGNEMLLRESSTPKRSSTDIEVKRATFLPGRADDVDRAREPSRHRAPRPVLAALLRLRRRAAAGRGRRALRAPHRPQRSAAAGA